MISSVFPPALLFIAGAFLIPFLKVRAVKSAYMIALPIAAFAVLMSIPEGTYGMMRFLDHELFMRFDRLSMVFGYIFVIITMIGMIYALHVKDDSQHVAAFIYAGSALGVVFSGDFFSLFFFWELLTLSALYIIWSGGSKDSHGAGFRYLLVHLFGGLCLLSGIILRLFQTGSIEFGYVGLDLGLSSWLILIGFAINAAVPPLHAWLTDAYPEASVTGAVFLSAFTTKTAVYVLARGFPGAEVLVVLGAIMTVFPIFFAVLENDLRRVLSYSLINQVGFMVVGIGIGTSLALNGTTAHAFAHILYKALLFMSVGAVLFRLGTAKATELGGLYKTMPLTLIFCVIGAASISAFPLFSGFIAKSLITSAVAYEGLILVWLALLFASAGVFHHAGIKVPYFTFFAHDSGKRPKEAPLNMLIAMGIASFLCIFIGVFPSVLYNILPYPVSYVPYTADHVVSQLLLLCFAAVAFGTLMRIGYYPPEKRAVNLDTDWLYRRGGPAVVVYFGRPVARFTAWLGGTFVHALPRALIQFGKNPTVYLKIAMDTILLPIRTPDARPDAKKELAAAKENCPAYVLKPWSIGSAMAFATLFLGIYMLVYFIRSMGG
ncbi:MAG: Na(+)/H(+) antiporter subunit D [Firmicutes bacterium]|nr:Na(+)/H(+) antiporter subunit D [Bacillota bacterium]MBU4532751.1 Na(+)/H(+) antiporter subunit D [Bacillota bacterium]MBU4554588.1 Na(+)/H(+) antiporter subunit D [Bacillota bacterium]